MFLRFTLANVLASIFLGAAVAAAQAQVNIDQGKSAAQIFANDCAACHKATRGLANGKNSAALASFLRDNGAEAVSVGPLDYVYTRENPLYAALEVELDKPATQRG